MQMNRHRLQNRRSDQSGAVAIVVALSMLALVVVGAMVLDFGILRVNRLQLKQAADSATMSGLRAADGGTTSVYTYRGVCGALSFLKANNAVFNGLSDDLNTCPTPNPNVDVTCDKTNPFGASSAAHFMGTVTAGGGTYKVEIKAPYQVSDGNYSEETLASRSSDTGGTSALGACDQLAVMISMQKKPGLGSMATSSDLKAWIRSVGRIQMGDGDNSPALLLLERSECGVLVASGGPARILVKGTSSPASVATIHSDSTATGPGCGSGPNQQLFQGNQSGAIVAFGDGTTAGKITSVASDNGVAQSIVQDSVANVYGTKGVYPNTVDTVAVGPRAQVTRGLVDKRYLSGVTTAVRSAYSEWTKLHSAPSGYNKYFDHCPTAADMTTMATFASTDAVYIDCPGSSGITLNGTIGAGKIYFHGFIKGGVLNLPNATAVYVDNTKDSGDKISNDAFVLGTGDAFCVRGTACNIASPSSGQCSNSPTLDPTAKAQLFIRRGMLNGSGTSLLRLCNTTVIMEGGQLGAGTVANPGGCLPTTNGTPPTATPCTGASAPAGTSQINSSGSVDWTAPNAYGDLKASPVYDDPATKQGLWDGGEDLALWDETYGDNTSGNKFAMQGGGFVHVAGVFMVPNARPFNITGSADLDLTGSQFIVTKFSVNGGAKLTMGVDPYNAVPEPKLTPFTLVR